MFRSATVHPQVWDAVLTLKFYGDESADQTRSRVFTVAGVFGIEEEWTLAIQQWQRITRGRKFHANEWELPVGRTTEEHNEFKDSYRRLTISLAESHLVGIAISLDLGCLQKHLPGLPPETAYCKCFTDVLRLTGELAKEQEDEELAAKFEYVFDSRLETDGTASQIYQSFRLLPEWRETEVFDTKVVFEGGDEPRLEMADLLAREAMKEIDRTLTGIPPQRRLSFGALDSATVAGVKKFHFRHYGDDYCAKWRQQVDSPQGQSDRKEYEQWLVDNGCVQNGHTHDTIANRSRFYNWLENKEALLKKKDS